jgi:hypothetical protein
MIKLYMIENQRKVDYSWFGTTLLICIHWEKQQQDDENLEHQVNSR